MSLLLRDTMPGITPSHAAVSYVNQPSSRFLIPLSPLPGSTPFGGLITYSAMACRVQVEMYTLPDACTHVCIFDEKPAITRVRHISSSAVKLYSKRGFHSPGPGDIPSGRARAKNDITCGYPHLPSLVLLPTQPRQKWWETNVV